MSLLDSFFFFSLLNMTYDIGNASFMKKTDLEAKIASLEVPAIGVVSQLQLGTMKVMGRHNYDNAAVAALSILGLDIGVDVEALNSTIKILKTPPHRMQIGKML